MCIAAPTSNRRYLLPNLSGVVGYRGAVPSDNSAVVNNKNDGCHNESLVEPTGVHDLSANAPNSANGFDSGNQFGVSFPCFPQDNVYVEVGATSAASPAAASTNASNAPLANANANFTHQTVIASPQSDNHAVTVAAAQLGKPKPRFKRRRRGPQPPGKTATNKERLFVKHNYHDLAHQPDIPLEGFDIPEAKDEDSNEKKKPHTPLSIDSFPMKLHRILDQIEAEGLAKIVAWQPHGRAFLIRDYSLFVSVIMPRYFPKIKKLTSLQRQLNLYGFERLTREGPDEGAYYHECFLRGRPGLTAQRMVRKRVKGTGYKAASNPGGEPDLYAYPFVEEVLTRNSQAFTAPAMYQDNSSMFSMNSTNQADMIQFHQSDSGFVTDSTRSVDRNSWATDSSTAPSLEDGASHDQVMMTNNNNAMKNFSLEQLQQQQWNSSLFVQAMQQQVQAQNQSLQENLPVNYESNQLSAMPNNIQFQFSSNNMNFMANEMNQSYNSSTYDVNNNSMFNGMNSMSNFAPTESMAFNNVVNQAQGNSNMAPMSNNTNGNGHEDQSVLLDFADLWDGHGATALTRRQNCQDFSGRVF
mmetsp:Transcript_6423/g.13143  ORF Transcript_6423/g.13143 Transcript_6423/m.13143 type:complete len:582 (+) Transcript_6423:123-1868(+)